MSDKITKTMTVTPLTVETKELTSKRTGEPYQKVEITCELPTAGRVWMKAWPEDCAGIAPNVPFEAEVTATPKDNGGYFYDFRPVRKAPTPGDPADSHVPSHWKLGDAKPNAPFQLFVEARFNAIERKLNQLLGIDNEPQI